MGVGALVQLWRVGWASLQPEIGNKQWLKNILGLKILIYSLRINFNIIQVS